MAKPPNYTVWARRSSRMSYVCYKKKFLLGTLLIQFKLVYGPFGQNNRHSILYKLNTVQTSRKESNVLNVLPKYKKQREKLVKYNSFYDWPPKVKLFAFLRHWPTEIGLIKNFRQTIFE